jgi:hypothetical protein
MWVFHLLKKHRVTNKTILGNWKMQQASSTIKDKLKKTLHVTLDSGNCGWHENLKLIRLGKNMRLLQNVQLKLQSVPTVTEKGKLISLLSHSGSIKITAELGVSQYIVRKRKASQKTCGILPEVEKKKGQPLSDAVTQTNFMRIISTAPCVLARRTSCL